MSACILEYLAGNASIASSLSLRSDGLAAKHTWKRDGTVRNARGRSRLRPRRPPAAAGPGAPWKPSTMQQTPIKSLCNTCFDEGIKAFGELKFWQYCKIARSDRHQWPYHLRKQYSPSGLGARLADPPRYQVNVDTIAARYRS